MNRVSCFVTGFAGTATISSTGFAAGAISGAVAGITNGLISGTGNGMMSGMNFKDAFIKGGLDQAWKQGFSGAAFGVVMGTLDAIKSHEHWFTGSPYKKYAYTNGEIMMTPDAAATKAMTSIKKDASVELARTNEPYSIEIKAPNGWEVTDGKFVYSNGAPIESFQYVSENNSLYVEFPVGSPDGGGYADTIL